MNASRRAGAVVVVLLLVTLAMGAEKADVKVTVSDIHLCCKVCVKAVEKAAGDVKGVHATVSQDDGTAVLAAEDYDKIQKAINKIAQAGFHGTLSEADAKHVAFKPTKTPEGKVAKLEVSHIHNCCKGCSEVIKAAVEGVEGVTSSTVEPKKDKFVVEGDFVAADVVKALQESGFSAKVK